MPSRKGGVHRNNTTETDMLERFYRPGNYTTGTLFSLTGAEHHHLSRVMRLKKGEEIELVNGSGGLAKGKIEAVEKEETRGTILSVFEEKEKSTQILLGIPLMRPSKLEWIFEKGTEIGADAFLLYEADRSIQESLSPNQQERFRTITISALKQSKRLFLPRIEILPHLSSLLEKEAEIFFGDLRQKRAPWQRDATKQLLFVTGPEGGFSEKEIALLDQKGKGVCLCPYILRAETAPLVALSLLINI